MNMQSENAILRDFIARRPMEFSPKHVDDWCDLPSTATMFDFDRYVYRLKQTPAAAQLAGMPIEKRHTVSCAYTKGEKIEWRPLSIGVLPWKPLAPESGLDFSNCEYRIKPVALRPHYPALVRDMMMRHSVSTILFASDAEASHIIGFVRLATEYPPVMLP
jgi:hypothetical protein